MGLATALVVANALGLALVALFRTLPTKSLPDFINGDVAEAVVFVGVALLVLTGTNQLFGERWRVLLVLSVLLGSQYLSLYLAREFPWDPKGDGFGTLYPYGLLYAFVGWIVPPLAVGWWTVRARRLRLLDLSLCLAAGAVVALLFFV